MSHFVALNPKQHHTLRVQPNKVAKTGASEQLIPVVLSEFNQLIIQYPIVFTKNAKSGQFVCAAMLGFEEGENLFWNEQQWNGLYIPAQVERHPFYIGQSDDKAEEDQHLVCLDTDSEALSETEGEPLFEENGQPTTLMSDKQELLAMLLDGEPQTRSFIKALSSLDLLAPIALEISLADGSSRKVTGLYTIDEDKLSQLCGETVAMLHEKGFLAPAYTLLASHAHIYSLIERKNARLLNNTEK